jgi:hypothetical protein
MPATNDPDAPMFSNAIDPSPETAIVIEPSALVMEMFAPGVIVLASQTRLVAS